MSYGRLVQGIAPAAGGHGAAGIPICPENSFDEVNLDRYHLPLNDAIPKTLTWPKCFEVGPEPRDQFSQQQTALQGNTPCLPSNNTKLK